MVEVTGIYGLSALVVFFNTVLAAVATAHGRLERGHIVALSVLTALMIVLPALGRWRLAALAARPPVGRLTVGVAQGNVAQERKWDPAFVDETMRRYEELTGSAVSRSGAQLVVWPETATPFFFQEPGPERARVLELARRLDTFILFGSPAATFDGQRLTSQRNRAYLVGPKGEIDYYDKMELVPFGEYVPFGRVLFFVQQVVEAVGALAPGTRATVFDGPEGRFGVLVCYESIFPQVSQRFVHDGADFLVNITNDAWYGHTAAPYQHLAQATMRTVENRVPLVRAANTGISAIVGDDGRIAWAGPLDQLLEHTEEISWRGVRTFYTRFGDVFVWSCVVAVVLAGIAGLRRRPES
jgi:apolipoprotein N-acyltransferase